MELVHSPIHDRKGVPRSVPAQFPSTIEISNISCIKRAIYRGFLISRVYTSARNCEAMEACNDDKTHSNERIGKQRTSLRPGLVNPDVAHLRSASLTSFSSPPYFQSATCGSVTSPRLTHAQSRIFLGDFLQGPDVCHQGQLPWQLLFQTSVDGQIHLVHRLPQREALGITNHNHYAHVLAAHEVKELVPCVVWGSACAPAARNHDSGVATGVATMQQDGVGFFLEAFPYGTERTCAVHPGSIAQHQTLG